MAYPSCERWHPNLFYVSRLIPPFGSMNTLIFFIYNNIYFFECHKAYSYGTCVAEGVQNREPPRQTFSECYFTIDVEPNRN